MKLIDEAGVWRPGKRRKLTWHRNAGLEIVSVVGGTVEWSVEGEAYRVAPGSVFFTWPWEWHGGVREAMPGLELSFVVLGLDRVYRKPPPGLRFGWHPDLPLKAQEGRQIKKALIDSPSRMLPLSESMATLVRTLAETHTAEAPWSAVVHRSLAAQVLVELARTAQGSSLSPGQVRDTDKRVQAFIEQMKDRCHEPWSVESMASACGLGRARLNDIVRRHTGDTPLMLMNRLRIERAQRLLQDGDAKVIDIALACGFSTPQHFCRVFREYTSTTPSVHRQRSQAAAKS